MDRSGKAPTFKGLFHRRRDLGKDVLGRDLEILHPDHDAPASRKVDMKLPLKLRHAAKDCTDRWDRQFCRLKIHVGPCFHKKRKRQASPFFMEGHGIGDDAEGFEMERFFSSVVQHLYFKSRARNFSLRRLKGEIFPSEGCPDRCAERVHGVVGAPRQSRNFEIQAFGEIADSKAGPCLEHSIG